MGFYDNEIKRLCTKSPRLLTMAINHIFKKNHCLDTPVIFLDREQNVDEHPTFMDMLVQIEDCKYHIEYQLLEGNMAIRMYVYAVKETIVELESVTEYSDKYEVNVKMPQQTVIFLSGANRKNEIKVNLTLPDNKVVSYMLPCISASETIAQLSEKKLYLLFPFQQVQLNSKMNKLAGKKTEYKQQIAEQMYHYRTDVRDELARLEKTGEINQKEYDALLESLMNIEQYMLKKNRDIKKAVEKMGEKDYIAYSDQLRAEGEKIGRQAGMQVGVINQICRKLLKNKPLEQIADELEEEVAFVKPLYDIAVKYAPDYDAEKIYEEYIGKTQTVGK